MSRNKVSSQATRFSLRIAELNEAKRLDKQNEQRGRNGRAQPSPLRERQINSVYLGGMYSLNEGEVLSDSDESLADDILDEIVAHTASADSPTNPSADASATNGSGSNDHTDVVDDATSKADGSSTIDTDHTDVVDEGTPKAGGSGIVANGPEVNDNGNGIRLDGFMNNEFSAIPVEATINEAIHNGNTGVGRIGDTNIVSNGKANASGGERKPEHNDPERKKAKLEPLYCSNAQQKCYCCEGGNAIIEYNQRHQYVTSSSKFQGFLEGSSAAFPGYFHLNNIPSTPYQSRRIKFVSSVNSHSEYIFETSKPFYFISDASKKIICGDNHPYKFAFSERFAIFLQLVKRYLSTRSINPCYLAAAVDQVRCEGEVSIGNAHLSAFATHVSNDNSLRWADFFGSTKRFGILMFAKHELKDGVNEQKVIETHSKLGRGQGYGTTEYKEMKKEFFSGKYFQERRPPAKFISPADAKILEHRIAYAMSEAFKKATLNITNLTSDFAAVHQHMTEEMLAVVKTFPDIGTFQYQLSDEGRNTFEDEASLLLGKFTWMVLQHIRSFSQMLSLDKYMELVLPQPNSPDDLSRGNKSYELEPVGTRRTKFFRFDSEHDAWERVEGILPNCARLLRIGDTITFVSKTPFGEAFQATVRISRFSFGPSYESVPIDFDTLNSQGGENIVLVPPAIKGGVPERQITQQIFATHRVLMISSCLTSTTRIKMGDSEFEEELNAFFLIED